jgi:hypothetical protein
MGSQIGIFSGKKVFSHDTITAQITDAANYVWFVPVRYMIGDYFLTEINKQIYAFKMDGARIKTAKTKGAKSFQILYYDVSHYLPISPDDIVNIENIIRKNSLPTRMDKKLLNVYDILSKTEKNKDFTVHDITAMKARLLEHKDRYKETVSELINFMTILDADKIVTPLKRMVDFLQGDLKTIDAKFMGTIFTQAEKMEEKAQKILNPVLTAKKSWVVLILGIALVGAICGMVYFMNEAGVFENLGSSIPSIAGGGAGDYSEDNLRNKYPTGAALKAAVDSGQLDYKKLPPIAKKIYDEIPTPGT